MNQSTFLRLLSQQSELRKEKTYLFVCDASYMLQHKTEEATIVI